MIDFQIATLHLQNDIFGAFYIVFAQNPSRKNRDFAKFPLEISTKLFLVQVKANWRCVAGSKLKCENWSCRSRFWQFLDP